MKSKLCLVAFFSFQIVFFVSCEKALEPVASFNISDSSAKINEEISFTNTSQNATDFEWNFGDGVTSIEENPKHSYSNDGSYTIELTATGEGGSNSTTQTITIEVPSPIAGFSIDLTSAVIGDTITFTNESQNATEYNWDFGDGVTSTEENPTHSYTSVGSFTVSLIASSSHGSDSEIKTNIITINLIAIDFDGNVYKTVQIGKQIWLSENLKSKHYSDGTPIPLVESTADWKDLDSEDKAYCYYGNSESYGDTYGALYTWAAAMNGSSDSNENPSGIQGVCPSGWHIPSDKEWQELEIYLGMSQTDADATYYRGTNQGGKLKESGYLHWAAPNFGANNVTGFRALPAGFRSFSFGTFMDLFEGTHYWTSTVFSIYNINRELFYTESGVGRYYGTAETNGFSVRCVKD